MMPRNRRKSRRGSLNADTRVQTVNHGQPRRVAVGESWLVPGSRRTKHLLIAQLLNPVAQLGSKCLYVLQSKARERGRRVLWERIRSDILRASTRKHPPSRVPAPGLERRVQPEHRPNCLYKENCGFAGINTLLRRTLRIIVRRVCTDNILSPRCTVFHVHVNCSIGRTHYSKLLSRFLVIESRS